MDLGVDLLAWLALALGALIVGFGKTAIGGAVTISVVLFAAVLPTRESTGVLLVLLMLGDVIAVWSYSRDAHVSVLVRLIVPVVVGIVLGAVFLRFAPAQWLSPVIGGIVVVMSLIEIVQRLRRRRAGAAAVSPRDEAPTPLGGGQGYGSLAGFTTMVANSGGPVMSLYLLRADLSVRRFVGTFAWFFFAVNIVKLPFSIGLGLLRPERIPLLLTLVPAVLLGAALGRWLIGHIPRTAFEWTILLTALLSGAYLMVT